MATSTTPTQADINKRKAQTGKLSFNTRTTSGQVGAKPAAGSVGMTAATRKKLGY